jgi:phospholipase/carboxylesterase
MSDSDKQIFDSIGNVLAALLNVMRVLEHGSSFKKLMNIAHHKKDFESSKLALEDSSKNLIEISVPKELDILKAQLLGISELCSRVIRNFQGTQFQELQEGLSLYCRAQEKLYPLSKIFQPVSQFFLEKKRQNDSELIRELAAENRDQGRGIRHRNNRPGERGGFSVYIPENTNQKISLPLVVALHGSSGHGADFLWNWLKEARSRSFLLLCPTSTEQTWSLENVREDLLKILEAINKLSEISSINSEKILITGMSDGATFSMLAGLRKSTPFTHIAAFSGIMPASLAEMKDDTLATDRPVFLVHGTEDKMFPVETAYLSKSELETEKVEVVLKIKNGLGHAYARNEHDSILNWFDPELAL